MCLCRPHFLCAACATPPFLHASVMFITWSLGDLHLVCYGCNVFANAVKGRCSVQYMQLCCVSFIQNRVCTPRRGPKLEPLSRVGGFGAATVAPPLKTLQGNLCRRLRATCRIPKVAARVRACPVVGLGCVPTS